ncbi:MAG TPA: hypothetical protein VK691_09940 [Solirubrobacteraceae bacterium]|nr:hypothetical protein [Solirubrobacteraceae bacterium]
MRSAVELGVSLPFDASAAAARFWKGAEAVRVGGEEGVVWVALWLCVAALSALVPGVGFKSDWSRDSAVVVSTTVVWGIAVLGCSVPCGPDAFGLPPGSGATVDGRAAAVEADGGAGVRVGLAESAGAPVVPAVGAVEVDPGADGEP